MDDYQALMEEPPGGDNHGRVAVADPGAGDELIALDVESHQTEGFMRSGGFGVVETTRGGNGHGSTYGSSDAGMTSSRTTNDSPYVDHERIRALVVEKLGFSLEEVASAYATGRPNAQRLLLRDRIDARLLEVANAGGNMLALARVFGWSIVGDGECRAMAGALRRARAET